MVFWADFSGDSPVVLGHPHSDTPEARAVCLLLGRRGHRCLGSAQRGVPQGRGKLCPGRERAWQSLWRPRPPPAAPCSRWKGSFSRVARKCRTDKNPKALLLGSGLPAKVMDRPSAPSSDGCSLGL